MARLLRGARIVGLGSLGVVLVLCALHLYVDHQSLHILIGLENARIQSREGK